MANNTNSATNTTSVSKQPAGPAPAPKDSLQEEQQLEDMLDRLDQVHLQASLLRKSMQLRSALPRMLEPLMRAKHPTPEAMRAALLQAVDKTNKDIASFQEAHLRLQTDGVLPRARASQKNSKGLKHWRASDHPDWANPDRKRHRLS
ncbi:hypothetical protein N658DRAFT_415749 [Parathielavia hyrcaniae]|uniref:Uncharacterized protein n=1 Tax=Parathielavia hyrcaniae TaxID=113614 RepID=A0AAN6T7B2_9PEZI|nr:hypothetical protein N658DRAFT_415749 [Parathielavia hyrcaniae]